MRIRRFVRRALMAVFVILVVASLGGSMAALGSESGSSGVVYLALINFNLLLIAGLLIYAVRRFVLMFLDRRRGLVGARLHVRLLGIFSALAVLPALLVAGFSVFFLNLAIESWFSNRVTSALDGSIEVAQAYFEENGNRLLSEARSLARDPSLNDPSFLIDPGAIEDVLRQERQLRSLAEVSLYDHSGTLLAHVGDLPPMASAQVTEAMVGGDISSGRLFADYDIGRLVAIAPLNDDMLIVLSRWVSPAVLNHMNQTRAAYQEYYELRSERGKVRVMFSLSFVLMTCLVLAAAIWSGLNLASRIVRPVTNLVMATRRVREGDMSVRVDVEDDDEIGVLASAFNQMAERLEESHTLLESKNRELDERRRTIEAVLTGVSSGVMALDNKGNITLANRTARDVLGARTGGRISRLNEAMAHMYEEFMEMGEGVFSRQIKHQQNDVTRTLLVRMVAQETAGGRLKATVITFEDITELLTVQRVAAWADVARRLAHEIKNPLTPIQLSAERLKRKYGSQIKDDQETFMGLTETIVRQVGELRQMVNEFSDFARMPAAVFRPENLAEILQEIILLEREARTDIQFDLAVDSPHMMVEGDRAHLRRAFTNIVENAVNAVEERDVKTTQGHINIVAEKLQGGKLAIVIDDNGRGLPDVDVQQLFDPYVTTRKKGTGLGLAIVRKVIDEHQGTIRLLRRDGGGARVEVILPAYEEEEPRPNDTATHFGG